MFLEVLPGTPAAICAGRQQATTLRSIYVTSRGWRSNVSAWQGRWASVSSASVANFTTRSFSERPRGLALLEGL